jgi:hypothetical protein
VALCIFSKVSVKITDAADEVGNSNFIFGWFSCLLEVRESQRGMWYSRVSSGKDMA